MDKKTTSLLQGSLEKARAKLAAAQQLFHSKLYDDAVSRAYYAAFHAAQAVLLTEGLTAGTHQGLVNLFGLHLVKTGKFEKKFGRYLANLKDDREHSDYEIYSTIDETTAHDSTREATEFVAAVEQYLTPFLQR